MLGKPLVRRSFATSPRGQGFPGDREVPRLSFACAPALASASPRSRRVFLGQTPGFKAPVTSLSKRKPPDPKPAFFEARGHAIGTVAGLDWR